MTALVSKSSISGTPSRATANNGFAALWDWLNERFGAGTGTAAEKAATRAALEASRTIQPIAASVASSALTVTVNPTATEFRNATLNNGSVTMLANAAALSCTIPNGATLGSASGVKTCLAVLELNNAGTKEIAVVNLSGGVDISEAGLISTTALSTASDFDNVVYSTVARTNVPYRIVDFIEYTQATAGVYATAPSLVGGTSAPLAKFLCGYGQSLQSGLTRSHGVTYTNTTGRAIKLYMSGGGGPSVGSIAITINGRTAALVTVSAATGYGAFCEIPAGATYVINETNIGTRANAEMR